MRGSSGRAAPEYGPDYGTGPGVLPDPPGSMLVVVKRDEVIVWLVGDVDVNLSLQLHDVAQEAPRVARRLVVDGSRVTFCDSTLLRFIAIVSASMPVIVRRPSQIFADILAFSGLSDRVSVVRSGTAAR